MKIGDYDIRTDLKWSSDYAAIENFLAEFEGRLAAVSDSLHAQRALMRAFVEEYLVLRNEHDGTALPVNDIVRACDHKTAWSLWRTVAGFF